MRSALFPGSFDPPTHGHIALIQRASHLFDRLIVAIAVNPNKKNQGLLPVEKRVELLKHLTTRFPRVEVHAFEGLIVDFAKQQQVSCLIRGLRAFSDFESELQMALANRRLSGIETLFLVADEHHSCIRSSLVREIASFGGPLSQFVPPEVEMALK